MYVLFPVYSAYCNFSNADRLVPYILVSELYIDAKKEAYKGLGYKRFFMTLQLTCLLLTCLLLIPHLRVFDFKLDFGVYYLRT